MKLEVVFRNHLGTITFRYRGKHWAKDLGKIRALAQEANMHVESVKRLRATKRKTKR